VLVVGVAVGAVGVAVGAVGVAVGAVEVVEVGGIVGCVWVEAVWCGGKGEDIERWVGKGGSGWNSAL
jgi:hypothetical protein